MIGRDSHDLKPWERLLPLLAWGTEPVKGPLPARILVVAWGANGASISLYQRSGLNYTRLNSFDIEWTDEEQHSHEVIGERIAREMHHRDITVQDVVASVPRRFVVLKNLELPPTEQASIAGMVYLQCENLFPVSRATLEIDFLQHESPADADTSILVCAVPKPVVQVVVDSLKHARLKPLALGVGELGIPFLTPSVGTNELQFDLLASGNKLEFLISRNQLPVISHAGQAPELESERARYICSTMNRLLQAAAQRLPDLKVTKIQAYGDFDDATAIEIRRAMRIPIQYHAEATASEIKDLALLAAYEQAKLSIDFLNPRKPLDPAIELRRKVVFYATIAAALVILFGLPLTWSNYRLDRQLAKIQESKATLAQQVERLEPLEKTWKKLVAFERARFDYANELRDILNRLQPCEQMHLESLELSESTNSGIMVVRFIGRIKDREAWTSLTNDLLAATDQYRLRAPLLEPIAGDGHYAHRFTIELELKSMHSENKQVGT
ncbi:MAG: hypothetical protein SFV81_09245 [Pirellulaceae bacterium]|nr:hypothetical protein [Pirellulaceae bacterium]